MGCDKMYDVYTIKEGDTIESIANKYNITPYILYQLNGINNNVSLIPGNNIIVPKIANTYFDYYTIKKGDTIYQIARDYKVNPTLLALLNGLNSTDYIYPDQSIMIPKKDFAYYITKEGDTLKTVADTFNTNVSNLLKYNDTIYLQEGQLIVNKIN